MRRTHFLLVETTTISLFLSIIQGKTNWNKDIFKKRVMYELRCLYINPVQEKRHRCWFDNEKVIDCKKACH